MAEVSWGSGGSCHYYADDAHAYLLYTYYTYLMALRIKLKTFLFQSGCFKFSHLVVLVALQDRRNCLHWPCARCSDVTVPYGMFEAVLGLALAQCGPQIAL